MRSLFSLPALLIGLLLLSACASSLTRDIEVHTETDPKANLAAYKSYAWLGSAGLLNDPQGLWKPKGFDVDREIRKLIDSRLQAKGMVRAGNQPDLLVGYVLGIDMDALELKKNPKTNFETLHNVPKGALVVVLVDADSGFPVWVGEAVANVKTSHSDAESRKRLDYAISEMFSQLPR